MGKARVNMEFIAKEKPRTTTFKKRREGLMKKMHEFTTLCGVTACMIIYKDAAAVDADIWPPEADQVRTIIDMYKDKKNDYNKTTGLPEFFRDRKKRIEEELQKLRRKNREAKYPTEMEVVAAMDEPQLREFAAFLGGKVDTIKSRVEFLKRNRDEGLEIDAISQYAQAAAIEMHAPIHHQYIPPPAMDHSHYLQQELHNYNQQTSMVMLLMNEDNAIGEYKGLFEATPTPAPAPSMADHHLGFFQSSKAMAMCYAMPPVQPVAPFRMPYTVLQSISRRPLPPPLQFPGRGEMESNHQGDGESSYIRENVM